MIILISGATHSGKTSLAQRLLEKYNYPYLSIDHLKMGLIRSGYTDLTPMSGIDELTNYLWPIVREMIKTAIENDQNLIIEGCYIPFDYEKDFNEFHLRLIKYVSVILSEHYIVENIDKIMEYRNAIETRLYEFDLSVDDLIRENHFYLDGCLEHNKNYILINEDYEREINEEWNDLFS